MPDARGKVNTRVEGREISLLLLQLADIGEMGILATSETDQAGTLACLG